MSPSDPVTSPGDPATSSGGRSRGPYAGQAGHIRPAWFVVSGVVVVAIIAAAVAMAGVYRSRPSPTDDDRQTVLAATRDALTAVMTYDPQQAVRDRTAAQTHLTGLLAAEYRTSGPDVVFPGAVQAGARLTVVVIGVGVHEYRTAEAPDEARVLAFIDLDVSSADSGLSPGRPDRGLDISPAALARWVRMRDVDGRWLMADLRPVGDLSR